MSTKGVRILLDPQNPHDFNDGGLDELAGSLRDGCENADVGISLRPEEGYGGPFSEVLSIWLDVGAAVSPLVTINTVAKIAGDALRGRWLREKDACGPDEQPRARSVVLYDHNGAPLKSVRIDQPDGAPRDEALPERAPRPFPGHGG